MRSGVKGDPLNKKYIARNIKPYKSLKRFSTPKGLKGLKNKNYAQLERLAAIAVLKKAGVKKRKLKVKLTPKQFSASQVKRARAELKGRDPETMQDAPKRRGLNDIKNLKVRRAARHLTTVRRNRKVMKTNIYKGRGYDISKGHVKVTSFS